MLTADSFLKDIDGFLASSGMSASAFGRSAVGDPNLVGDLRQGRMPSLRTVARVQSFMAGDDKAAPKGEAARATS